jgi:uncharacterized Zn finger protein (UPF0148 family)
MFLKPNNPCLDPECPYCVLHCPYCGTTNIFLDAHEGSMGCPACRKGEVLPAPEFVQMRHQQVRDLAGRSIADWKARARQLAAPMRWRWRTAMCYLDPVARAAIARCDDLMLNGKLYVDAMAQTQAGLPELQRYVTEHPSLGTTGLLESVPFLDDWL